MHLQLLFKLPLLLCLAVVIDAATGSALAQAINQPPQLCYQSGASVCSAGYGQGGFGAFLEEQRLITVMGTASGNIPIYAADPDSGSNNNTVTVVTFDPGNCGLSCQLNFPVYPNAVVKNGYQYTITAPIATMNSILQAMGYSIFKAPTTDFLFKITVQINDQGFTGACSDTNPNPCDKTATAIVFFDAVVAGTQPDRIFLDGLEQR